MATPAPKTAAGSVGTVETQFLDLPEPLRARLRPRAASGPRRLRDLRDAVAGARQRDPRLPRAERRRACGRLREDAAGGEHARRLRRRGARRRARHGARLVGRHDRPRQGVRHRPLLRRLHEPARRVPRHDRARRPSIRRPAGRTGRTSRSSPSPTWCGRERAFLDELGIERLAAVAGGSLGGMQAFEWAILYPDQVDAIVAIASTHAHPAAGRRVERDRAQRDHGRPGLAGRPLLRHRARARRRAWASRGWSATSPTCRRKALGDKFGRRLQFADDIRYTLTEPEFEVESYLRHQADDVRQALRRQHLPLHVAGADVLRSRAPVRRRIAGERASRRLGADAADRVQLRLAVSAVGLGGAGRRAARARQGRRAARDRGAVRPRLLPAGGERARRR